MFPSQKLTDGEIDTLLHDGWKIQDFRGDVPPQIWENLIQTFTRIGTKFFKVISEEKNKFGEVRGILIVSPEIPNLSNDAIME